MIHPVQIARRALAGALGGVLWLGFLLAQVQAASFIHVSELEKTSATEGSLLFTLKTNEKAAAFEAELHFDPSKVELSAPGSLQVPDATEGDFSVDYFKPGPGRLRVVLSSPRLLDLTNGTTFRVPVRAAAGVTEFESFFPVALTEMELSDAAGGSARPKVGASLRIKSLVSGARVNGKNPVALNLEVLKDASAEEAKVEYFSGDQALEVTGGVWKPPGSGAYQLKAKITFKDGSVSESRMLPVIVTGLGTKPVRGTYSGVVLDDSDKHAALATGVVQITTTTFGTMGGYSMRLVLNGVPLAASGRFDAESVATPTVVSRATGETKTYRIRFQQEATGFADAISGLVTDGTLSTEGGVTGGNFTSRFVANRHVWSTATNPATLLAGKYTLALPLQGDLSDAPRGLSLLTITPSGTVLGNFSLSDGTRSVLTGTVSKDGLWQPYLSLYSKAGFLAGALDFSDKGRNGILGGELGWRQNAERFAALDAVGEKFTPAGKGTVFAVKAGAGNLKIQISGGGLAEAIQENATLTSANIVQVPTPNAKRLNFRMDRIGGGLIGSFQAPGDLKSTPVTGVVLQTEQRALGYFSRNGSLGFVEIYAAP